MSLVIGFSGCSGALVAGDLREIFLYGADTSVQVLEKELYCGLIASDQQLSQRAAELSVSLSIRDDKEKVREREGILIGEVSESDGSVTRKRRLYLVPGEYAIADIESGCFTLRSRARQSSFIVLGNECTKRIAHEAIRAHWKQGTLEDAVTVMITAMETAASQTASVSRRYLLLQTRGKPDLSGILARDRQEIESGKIE